MIDGPDTRLHDEGIGTLLARALADAEQVARAEIELQKARIVAKIDAARIAVFMLVGAVATGSVALTALVVGALMILAQSVGPLWATVIVGGVLVASSGLLGWLAMHRFKRLFGTPETSVTVGGPA